MRERRRRGLLAVVAVLSSFASGCNGDPTTEPADVDTETSQRAEPTGEDLLARISEEGVIRVVLDEHQPRSSFDTKAGEWQGFYVDVATEIATRLDVDVDIQHQQWDVVTAGAWNGRWDMNVGSMTVTEERSEIFSFTPAFYYTPASVAVHEDNTSIVDLETDLDGKRIGAGVDTMCERWLNKSLQIPGYTFETPVDDPKVQTWSTEVKALEHLALGDGVRIDAAVAATPTIEQAIEDGMPIKIVGPPVFDEPLAIAFDQQSPIDNTSLVEEVSGIVEEMHADGTLASLSMKWYGEDITQARAA